MALYFSAASVGEAHDGPPYFQFVAVWTVFSIRFSIASFIYSCFDIIVDKRTICSKMHVYVPVECTRASICLNTFFAVKSYFHNILFALLLMYVFENVLYSFTSK